MRVIAGTARGRPLHAPAGIQIRPTLDRVREACFNIIGDGIEGARFLDLFAGTGANGIEALSRGASSAVFVDERPEALACVARNLDALGFAARGTRFGYVLPEGLARLRHSEAMFDIVYLDPPFQYPDYDGLLAAVAAAQLLAPHAWVILEHPAKRAPAAEPDGLSCFRTRRYGRVCLTIYA